MSKLSEMTLRQRQVLDGIVHDRTFKQIAGDLDISTKTVEYHWAKLKKIIGVKTQIGAALFAHTHNLK